MPNQKKVILFVVEGPTDQRSFALIFERIFADSDIQFDITHGDILTKTRRTIRINARDLLRDEVKNHLEKKFYSWKDLAKIVMLVDTDGAFIPDKSVLLKEDAESAEYTEEGIFSCNPERIKKRNNQKSTMLNALKKVNALTFRKIKVPFEVYYLSRNLEHALHDRIDDMDDAEKAGLSRDFSRRYKNDIEGFKKLLADLGSNVGQTNAESWLYIAQGTNSLSRCSNLKFLFADEKPDETAA